jgi:hypothetical protein
MTNWGRLMTFETLLEKLLDIERAAVIGDTGGVLNLAIAAEEMVLQLERELIDSLTDRPRRAA